MRDDGGADSQALFRALARFPEAVATRCLGLILPYPGLEIVRVTHIARPTFKCHKLVGKRYRRRMVTELSSKG